MMNPPSTDKLVTSLKVIEGFGRRYDYDVSFLEELMEASPGAFLTFEAAMPMARYRQIAPVDELTIAKITAAKLEDGGPYLDVIVKLAREAGASELVIRGALEGGEDLTAEQLDVLRYSHAAAGGMAMNAELFSRVLARWGREVVAELAIAITASRLYPTLKRALCHQKVVKS